MINYYPSQHYRRKVIGSIPVRGNFYRPQRSCGQGNIFAPVCHSVHGGGVCLSACWDTTPPWEQTSPWSRHPPGADPPGSRHPPGADTPWEQTPPWSRHPPGADTPYPPEQTPLRKPTPTPRSRPPEQTPPPHSRHPPGADTPPPPGADTPPRQTPSGSRHPSREADSSIRSMSGRYASYWNAFLFLLNLFCS